MSKVFIQSTDVNQDTYEENKKTIVQNLLLEDKEQIENKEEITLEEMVITSDFNDIPEELISDFENSDTYNMKDSFMDKPLQSSYINHSYQASNYFDSSIDDSSDSDLNYVTEEDTDNDEEYMEMISNYMEDDKDLQCHIEEYGLDLEPSKPTRSDGNCWYDAIADQVFLHGLADKPTNHLELRWAVCAVIPDLPQAQEWTDNLFGSRDELDSFLSDHTKAGEWTDDLGIMCQATALYIGRDIHIVGTANFGQEGTGYTRLESVPGADQFPAFTVGYFQDRHYQSLQRVADWEEEDSEEDSEEDNEGYSEEDMKFSCHQSEECIRLREDEMKLPDDLELRKSRNLINRLA